jgi:hypothetical protein
MNITRTSELSGVTRTLDLPISIVQILEWQGGKLIQEAFPQLNPSQREFLMTGITDDEWNTMLDEPGREELVGIDYEKVMAMMRQRN